MNGKSRLVLALLLTAFLSFTTFSCVFADAGYNDDFTSTTLNSFWTTAGTSSATFDLTTTPGYLRITSPTGPALSPTSNYDAPRILQPVTGNFEATTCVSGGFTQSGFRGGLLIWKDTNNYMRLEKWGTNQVLMYGVLDGVVSYQQGTLSSNYNPLYLKLEKSGTTLTGSWSSDGIAWNTVKSYTFNAADPVEVGLFVINVGTASFSADFDYFHIVPGEIFELPEYSIGLLAVPLAMMAGFIVFRNKQRLRISF
jgi:regulation of enolase protein 1 (concanavalin A-like superfamily)